MEINDIFVDTHAQRYVTDSAGKIKLKPSYAMIYKGQNVAQCYNGNEIIFNTLEFDMDSDIYSESNKDRFIVIGHFDIYKDIQNTVANAMLEGRI